MGRGASNRGFGHLRSGTWRISRRALDRIGGSSRSTTRPRAIAYGSSFPPFMAVKQLYSETVTNWQNPGGTGFFYKWNLNNTFDPNRTGTGHQPSGRDTMALIYSQYAVHKCAFQFTIRNSDADALRGWWYIDAVDDGITTAPEIYNWQSACEHPNAKTFMINSGNEQTMDELVTMSGGMRASNYLIPDIGTFNENFTANVGGAPTTPIRLILVVEDAAGGAPTAVTNVQLNMQLLFSVVYKEPNVSQAS